MLVLLWFSVYLAIVFGNPCTQTTQLTTESSKKTIQSPDFPLVRPPGPYTCTYRLKSHLENWQIYLIFDDFLTVCKGDIDCEKNDVIKVYDGENASFPLLGEYRINSERPLEFVSSEMMYIEYIVGSEYLGYEYSGFRASYKSMPPHVQVSNTVVETVMTSENLETPVSFPIRQYKEDFDVLWLFSADHILTLFIDVDISSIDSIILYIQVLDGLTSKSPILLEGNWLTTNLQRNFTINSKKNNLYMRIRSQDLKESPHGIEGVFEFGMENDLTACQGVTCSNGGTCQALTNGQFRCQCAPGYFALGCTRSNGCHDMYCENGGTCRDTIYATPFCVCPDDYYGRTCEFIKVKDFTGTINECPLQNHCFNGGTCYHSQDGYYCHCPPLYTGEFCIQKQVEVNNLTAVSGSKTQYLLTMIVPVCLLIIIYMIYKCRRKSWPGNYPDQSVNHRNQLYHDRPPSYEQVVLRPRSGNQVTEPPPPKYEDVIVVVDRNSNSEDIDKSLWRRDQHTAYKMDDTIICA